QPDRTVPMNERGVVADRPDVVAGDAPHRVEVVGDTGGLRGPGAAVPVPRVAVVTDAPDVIRAEAVDGVQGHSERVIARRSPRGAVPAADDAVLPDGP